MSQPIRLDEPALHVDVAPGGEIVLRGSFTSTFDGSVIDAATTQWPAGAPGGASVDAGGLIDFAGGGFHLSSRDPVTHEVHAIATGDAATACAALRVAAPCLPLRVLPQAQSRLMTMADWTKSLSGQVSVEIVAPPAYAPAVDAAKSPWAAAAAASLVAAAALAAVVAWRRRRLRSPAYQLVLLARRVQSKLATTDAVLAAPLSPAVAAALKALDERRVDATSKEGQRVAQVLRRVETALEEGAAREKADEERRAADELVAEVESALEAAEEARRFA